MAKENERKEKKFREMKDTTNIKEKKYEFT